MLGDSNPTLICLVTIYYNLGYHSLEFFYQILHNTTIDIDEDMRFSFITDAAKGTSILMIYKSIDGLGGSANISYNH